MQLPLILQGNRKKTRPGRPMLEVGSENLHIRKTIIISHFPSLPWDLLDASWKHSTQQGQELAPLGQMAGSWASLGMIFQIFHPRPRKCATRVNPGKAQGLHSHPS